MIDFTVAFDKLAQFESPYEIAAFLESQGVRATRHQGNKCALAVWMTDTTGETVFTGNIDMFLNPPKDVYGDNLDLLRSEHRREMTEPMKQFVRMFDLGYFPKLDKEAFFPLYMQEVQW